MGKILNTPILFIIFNRPQTTRRVFEEIKKSKPTKLYIVSDGPRNSSDEILCKEVRGIVDKIDWDCRVFKNYSDVNLGCKKRVSSGIDWFFENEELGIILEDDCLPDQTFFRFCEEMLIRYRDDERVGMVSGDNFQFGKVDNMHSYFFSRYSHIWGWATWRRAWQNYDVNISSWPKKKADKFLDEVFDKKKDIIYWSLIFDDVYNSKIDTWDYQWSYAFFVNKYLSVIPAKNLISNIGFDAINSTHTRRFNKFSNMMTDALDFPLNHPDDIVRNVISDKLVQKNNYPFFRYFVSRILKNLSK